MCDRLPAIKCSRIWPTFWTSRELRGHPLARAFIVPRRHGKPAERRGRKVTGLRRLQSIWQPGCRSYRPRSVSRRSTVSRRLAQRDERAVLPFPSRFSVPLPSLSGLATIMVAVVLGAALVVSAPPVVASGNSITFRATDDTTVEQSRASQQFGNDATIRVDGRPELRSLIRFNVSGIPAGSTITSAKLRLHVVDTSGDGGYVYGVSGAWTESTTWKTAPDRGAPVGSIGEARTRNAWVDVDVTSLLSGNGNVDLYVVSNASNGVDYSSSESRNAPQLVVEWSEPAPKATPTPSTTAPNPAPGATPAATTVTLVSTDDAYVDSNSSSSNFGSGTALKVDGSPLRRTLLRFAVPAPPSGTQSSPQSCGCT